MLSFFSYNCVKVSNNNSLLLIIYIIFFENRNMFNLFKEL